MSIIQPSKAKLERQGFDPNVHSINARQGRGPIPTPAEDTADTRSSMVGFVLAVATLALVAGLALIAWAVKQGVAS